MDPEDIVRQTYLTLSIENLKNNPYFLPFQMTRCINDLKISPGCQFCPIKLGKKMIFVFLVLTVEIYVGLKDGLFISFLISEVSNYDGRGQLGQKLCVEIKGMDPDFHCEYIPRKHGQPIILIFTSFMQYMSNNLLQR